MQIYYDPKMFPVFRVSLELGLIVFRLYSRAKITPFRDPFLSQESAQSFRFASKGSRALSARMIDAFFRMFFF